MDSDKQPKMLEKLPDLTFYELLMNPQLQQWHTDLKKKKNALFWSLIWVVRNFEFDESREESKFDSEENPSDTSLCHNV